MTEPLVSEFQLTTLPTKMRLEYSFFSKSLCSSHMTNSNTVETKTFPTTTVRSKKLCCKMFLVFFKIKCTIETTGGWKIAWSVWIIRCLKCLCQWYNNTVRTDELQTFSQPRGKKNWIINKSFLCILHCIMLFWTPKGTVLRSPLWILIIERVYTLSLGLCSHHSSGSVGLLFHFSEKEAILVCCTLDLHLLTFTVSPLGLLS